MTKQTGSARKAKFRVGQVVRCYGIPEIKEANKFLGYMRIGATNVEAGRVFYICNGNSIRESRLRALTKREVGK